MSVTAILQLLTATKVGIVYSRWGPCTGMFSYYRYHFLFHPKLPLRQKGAKT